MNNYPATQPSTDYDVVVVGAGPAGLCAAIAAGRSGARTLLLEEDSLPGGAAADYFILSYCGLPVEGIIAELQNRLKETDETFAADGGHTFDLHHFVIAAHALLRQSGVHFLPNVRVTGMERSEGVIQAVTAQARHMPGPALLRYAGKVFVDGTGNGDLAFMAGAKVMTGREARATYGESFAPEKADDFLQQMTWMFIVTRDKETAVKRPSHAGWVDGRTLVWGGGFECVNPLDPEELARTQARAWERIEERSKELESQGYRIISVAPRMGLRETRRILGDYVLNENDLRAGKFFEDRVCRAQYNIDPWEPKGENPLWKDPSRCRVPFYTIPYRSLLPVGLVNLLTSGRCISGSHIAMSSYRVMTIAALTGQAAGTAAAMAARQGIPTRQVDVGALQKSLRNNGFDLDTAGNP